MSRIQMSDILFIYSFVFFFAISFLPQLWLCFKEKNLIIRLLPVVLLFWTAALFVAIIFVLGSWEFGHFLMPALYSVFMLLMCGLA